MKIHRTQPLCASALLALLFTLNLPLSRAFAQGTAFTYQGRLSAGGAPYSGSAEFQTALWDAATGGTLLATNLAGSVSVLVSNGLFVLPLDFGTNFPGANRWLEIAVRSNSVDTFTTLAPRQQIMPTPYAIYSGAAASAGTAASASSVAATNIIGRMGLAQLPGVVLTNNEAGVNLSGVFNGDGTGLGNVNAKLLGGVTSSNFWQTGGNSGANGNWYLGTADYQPLQLRVNQALAFRLLPTLESWPNAIIGPTNNVIYPDVTGASIGGGVNNVVADTCGSAVIAGGRNNLMQLKAAGSVIGGGQWNQMGDGSVRSVISGGYSNVIRGFTSTNASGIARDITDGTSNTILVGETPPGNATIGGGYLNTIGQDCNGAVIGGGEQIVLNDGSVRSVVSGGSLNQIGLAVHNGFIGGGTGNTIGDNASYASLSGGSGNTIGSNCVAGVISGGQQNQLGGTAANGFIGGGAFNTIADGTDNTIIAGEQNTIGAGAHHSLIGGGSSHSIGSYYDTIGGGFLNQIQTNAPYATISGGDENQIADSSKWSFVGGGHQNVIQATNQSATIAGGEGNQVQPLAHWAFIGGGTGNVIQTNSYTSTIAGGSANQIQPFSRDAVIGGGAINVIQTNAEGTVIAGGQQNTIQPSATFSAIGGGLHNTLETNGFFSTISGGAFNVVAAGYGTVPGGDQNLAAFQSFAAGHRAKAATTATFVWADSTEADFVSSAPNQFLIRATGGVGINKTNPATALDVNGTITATAFAGSGTGLTGVAPSSGSGNYIQNQTAGDQVAGLRITGNGLFNGGRVGVGTTIPSRELEVQSPGDTEVGIKSTDSGGHLWTLQSSSVTGSANLDASFQVIDRTAGSSRLLIGTNGNLGVGTSAPQAKLHVAGSAVIQGLSTPASSGATNLLNLGSGATADGFRNGISFFEAASNPAMAFGYDGTGSAGFNALRIYDSSGTALFTFQQNGNVGIGTLTPGGPLDIQTSVGANANLSLTSGGSWPLILDQSPSSIFTITNGGQGRITLLPAGNVGIGTNNPVQKLHVIGNILASGTVTGSSDRNAKENFAAVNPRDVLEKVSALPITRWNYKEDKAETHLGPMAQDFYAAFALGMDDKHISMVDADGVALAAIQGLNQKVEAQRAELQQKQTEMSELRKQNRLLEQRLSALEQLILGRKGN